MESRQAGAVHIRGAEASERAASGVPDSAHILAIDNYDSFVYTSVGYLKTLGAVVDVVRNDAVNPVGNPNLLSGYDGVFISPGPGSPREAGVSEDVIRLCARTRTPMLGECLGMQALAEVYGARVGHAPTIRHGKTSAIEHEAGGIFEGIANPVNETRYHSLAVEARTLPDELRVTATAADDGTVQALQHEALPLVAVQFHPESVMSEQGYRIFANWLAMCGQASAVSRSEGLEPKVAL